MWGRVKHAMVWHRYCKGELTDEYVLSMEGNILILIHAIHVSKVCFWRKCCFSCFFKEKYIIYILFAKSIVTHSMFHTLHVCGQNKKLLHFLDLYADYWSHEATLQHALLNGNNEYSHITIPCKDIREVIWKKQLSI